MRIAHQTRTFSLSAAKRKRTGEIRYMAGQIATCMDFANVEARLFVESAMEMLSPLEQEIFSSCLRRRNAYTPIRQSEMESRKSELHGTWQSSSQKKTSKKFFEFYPDKRQKSVRWL